MTAFAEYGKLIAKPSRDGSSYGLMFVNASQDLVAVRNAQPGPKTISSNRSFPASKPPVVCWSSSTAR